MVTSLERAAQRIIDEIARRPAPAQRPMVVAIDGGSGSGKSTIARMVATRADAALVQADDFFSAGITNDGWRARTAAERAADAIDWGRVRREALEPLLRGEAATWHPFDFVAGERADGTWNISSATATVAPRPLIVVDGAYSTGPGLTDLVDLTVLVDCPVVERHRRLAAREEGRFLAAWHARWDEAEAHYFSAARPPSAFDVVVVNDG